MTYWSRTSSFGCSAIIAAASPRDTGARFERAEILAAQQPLDPELEERRRALDRRFQPLWIVAEDVGRIATGGQVGHLELDLESLFPLVATIGRGHACVVGVVRERHLARQVLQRDEVIVGERGTAGRDRDGHTCERERHHVGVSLADDDLAARHDLALGEVEAVEQPRLLIDAGLGRVLVLRALAALEETPAEADRLAAGVPDREHETRPERVLQLVRLVHEREAGVGEILA